MLKYDKFRHFSFNEIDHYIKKNNIDTNKYQKYFDQFNYINGQHYIENIRILKNFYDENRYSIKTKIKLTKNNLIEMLKKIEGDYEIIEITDNWLGERKINEDNIINGYTFKITDDVNLTELKNFILSNIK
jgi:hypothetical protein